MCLLLALYKFAVAVNSFLFEKRGPDTNNFSSLQTVLMTLNLLIEV